MCKRLLQKCLMLGVTKVRVADGRFVIASDRKRDMEITIAIAQQSKFGFGACSDSTEIVPRSLGGVSVALAWAGSGGYKNPNNYQTLLTQKIRSLIQEGLEDRMVLRAAHDYLYSQHAGKVAVALTLMSVDTATQTILLSRNSNCPVIVKNQYGTEIYDENAGLLGVNKKIKHMVYELTLEPGLVMACYSEGIQTAARKSGYKQVATDLLPIIAKNNPEDALFIAGSMVEQALEWADHKPGDSMTAVVMGICDENTRHSFSRTLACYPYPEQAVMK